MAEHDVFANLWSLIIALVIVIAVPLSVIFAFQSSGLAAVAWCGVMIVWCLASIIQLLKEILAELRRRP